MSKRKLKSKHMELLRPFIKDIRSVNYICKKFINESDRMFVSENKKKICFYLKTNPRRSRMTISNTGSVHLQYWTKRFYKWGRKYGSVPVGRFYICAHFTKKEIYRILKGSEKALELALKTKIFEGLK